MNASWEVVRYCIAGSIAFACDIAALYVAAEKLEFHYLIANGVGYSVGMIIAYLLNTHWVFSEHRYDNKRVEFALFNAVLIAGLVVSEMTIFCFYQVMQLDLLIAKIASAALTFGVNYFVRRRLLFSQPEHQLDRPSDPNSHSNTSLKPNMPCTNCQRSFEERETPEYEIALRTPLNGRSQFLLRHCPDCDLVITCGVTPEILEAAYASQYYGQGSQKFLGFIELALKFMSRRRARRLKSFTASEHDRPLKALDIGCGRGLLLTALVNAGFEARGLERSAAPLTRAIASKVHIGEITDPEISEERYDLITIWHVLEHLEAPRRILSECHRLLGSKGVIAIAIPNYGSLQRRMFGAHWFHLDVPRHVVHISNRLLERQLVSQGFNLESVRHSDFLQNTYGFIQSALNGIFLKRHNFLYTALTSGQLKAHDTPALFIHVFIAACIFPIAVIEGVISAQRKTGATVQVIARKRFD